MPNFQTSGAISFSQLQSRFGGSNPIYFSEYYRNGSYVDGTGSVTTTLGPSYSANNTYWYYVGSTLSLYWSGSSVYQASHSTQPTSITTGGYTYTRGSYHSSNDYGAFYYISRSQTTTSSINTGIPTSGTISLNQFYGAQY